MTSATPVPVPGAEAKVTKIVDRMAADDPAERTRAKAELSYQPFYRSKLIDAQADRLDLPPAAAVELAKALPAYHALAHLAVRTADRQAAAEPWVERLTLAGYEHDRHTDPKWDADTRRFLVLARRRYVTIGPAANAAVKAAATAAFQRAADLGCDDPSVLANAGLLGADTDRTADQIAALFDRANRGLSLLTAPYYRITIRGRLLRVAYAKRGTSGGDKQMADWGGAMVNDVHRLVGRDDVPVAVACQSVDNLVTTWTRCGYMAGAAWMDTVDLLAEKFPADAEALSLQGRVYIIWAWEGRGGDVAGRFGPQQWTDFADRLARANAILTRAATLDPGLPDPPTQLITVEMGQDQGRAVMEQWFARAMAADSDNYDACTRKLL